MRIRMMIAVTLLALLGLTAPPAGAECRVPTLAYKHGVVTFTEHGRTAQVRVEIADAPQSQEIGLMCRISLEPDAGMLFIFPEDTRGPFWMKNTLIPLSIAFIDARWHVVALMDMRVAPDPANPPPSDLFAPTRPYRYALEVNQGFFAHHGIDEKADVTFQRQTTAGPSPAPSSPARGDRPRARRCPAARL